MTARPLSIGFLGAGWHPDVGGVETSCADLARRLRERGHRVEALCLGGGAERGPYALTDEDVDGVRVRRVAYGYHDHRRLSDLVRNPRMEEIALAWCARRALDLVHVHHATGCGLGVIGALRDLGTPVVATLHDYWPLCPRGQMLRVDGVLCAAPDERTCARCICDTWPQLERTDPAAAGERTRFALAQLRRADLLIAPSRAARAAYARCGLSSEGIVVCANGIEVAALARAFALERARAAGPRPGPRIGVLGSVQPSKGVLGLARAAVAAAVPGLSLEVHGPLAPYHGDVAHLDELRSLAARHPCLRLHGPFAREELACVLAGLDALCVPSVWEEVFGLTAREALACGLPVAVSDVGGLAELGEAVLRVPPGDVPAWSGALRALAARAKEPARAHPGLRTAAEMAADHERLYRAVVRAARSHSHSSRSASTSQR